MGGAAGGCGVGHTPVHTLSGVKLLRKLEKGEIVLTFNKKKQMLEYKPVLETFINGGSVECVEIKLKDGKKIKFTQSHKFLFNGKWIEIGKLARRILERDSRKQWKVFDKQQREIKNKELEEFWENYDNESRKDKKGILENNYYFKQKKEKSSDTQVSGRNIYFKSTKQIRSKSQRFKQKEQSSREFGVGHNKREFSPCREEWINGSVYGPGRKQVKPSKEAWKPERNEQINRRKSKRDKTEIYSPQIWEETIGPRIQRKTQLYKRCYNKKKLEAREIDLYEIIGIRFYWQDELMYDIQTENESYILGNGIIVHNSKSFTGCLWQIMRRIKYPGSRGFLARARLKSLKESTLLTFFEVCRMLNLRMNVDYSYNAITGLIKFSNGSEEYLRDLFYYPSDPEFVGLGSTEYTDGFIDEMAEIGEQAYQIIRSRMRYKLDDFGLIPKIAMGSNPCKTFIYKEFYRKWNEDKLEHYKAYIPASVYDNPFISKYYIENLKKLDPINKARLLDGNWEYDDDPTRLFEYDAIVDMFTNDAERGEKYCIVDVAGRGRDRTMITNWDGLFCTKVIEMDNISNEELDRHLNKYQIPRSHCLVDEDGVGFGLVKDTPGVKGFVNNSRAIQKKKESERESVTHNYANLKAQCWFLLANYVNSGKIGVYREIDVKHKRILIEDLEQIKEKDPGRDRPLRVLTKEDIKEVLGRSTDLGDTFMMRMFFELRIPLTFDFAAAKPTINISLDDQKNEELSRQEKINKLVEEGKISFGPKTRGRKEKLTNNNV